MNKKILSLFVLLVVVLGATKAFASLTFSSTAITGDSASTIDVGAGNALSLQTVGNGNILTGSGNFGIGITPTNKLTVSGASNFTGHMAIGPAALVDSGGTHPNILDIEDTISTSSNVSSAIDIYTIYDPIINDLNYFGTDSWVSTPATNNKNIVQLVGSNNNVINSGTGNITLMEGSYFAAYQSGTGSVAYLRGIDVEAGNAGSLSITEQAAMVARIYNDKVGSTITNSYGLKISNIPSNAGTFTNTYGIYVGDVSIGTQTNYPFSFYASDANSYNYFAGKVGVGVTAPAQKLEVNGGVRLNTVTAKPACDATARGTFWSAQGGAGVKDTVEVCAKDATDAYAWRTLY